MFGKLFEDQKGISNLVATLILIAVAVVGGAFAYTAFRNQAQSTTTSADLQVQSLNAVTTDGTVYVSTTVKNVGTQRLTGIELKIVNPDDGDVVLDNIGGTPQALDPGQTGSDHDTGNLNAGEEYVVRITADTPNGSITKTTTVRVRS